MRDLSGKSVKIPKFKHSISDISTEVLSAFGVGDGKLVKEHYDKVIFLIMDGLGYKNLQDRRLLKKIGMQTYEVGSTIPSSTAPALTTIFTGSQPSQHGVLGFHFFLPGVGYFTPFHFSNEFGELIDIPFNSVVRWPSIFYKLKKKKINSEHLLKFYLSESKYTRGISKPSKINGFSTNSHLFEKLKTGMASRGKKLMLAYLESPDNLLHGGGGKEAYELNLAIILNLIKKLKYEKGSEKTLFLLASDHGHIPITYEKVNIRENWLRMPIAGGERNMLLNINNKFRDKIVNKLSKTSYVFDGLEFYESGLMGPVLDNGVRECVSDLMSFAFSEKTPFVEESSGFKSSHGGFTHEEMSALFGVVPLNEFNPKLKF